jgi:hypothetical protein
MTHQPGGWYEQAAHRVPAFLPQSERENDSVQLLLVVGGVRSQVDQLVVWKLAFPSSGADEFCNVLKSQAEFLSSALENGALLVGSDT